MRFPLQPGTFSSSGCVAPGAARAAPRNSDASVPFPSRRMSAWTPRGRGERPRREGRGAVVEVDVFRSLRAMEGLEKFTDTLHLM